MYMDGGCHGVREKTLVDLAACVFDHVGVVAVVGGGDGTGSPGQVSN